MSNDTAKKYWNGSLILGAVLLVMLLLFSRILFTDKIIRAPDIIHEFYWNVTNWWGLPLQELINYKLAARWWIESNSGYTLMGGEVGGNFNFWNLLFFKLVPPPASVAWFIVIHLFLGGLGLYAYCRVIELSVAASFIAGTIFALSPELVTLINAGHVMKLATICFAPWALMLLEKGFQRRNLIYFLATSIVLALQFFNSHWQISFYTCLVVGCYAVVRLVLLHTVQNEQDNSKTLKLAALNVATLVFFLTTVAIALAPLSQWSKDTNRGAQSGENSGKGGLNKDEAMSWSMPPEELAAFVVPGMFGLSRQEAGPNPESIAAFYWGRMLFTQTTSYFGLLPWLLLPLPLLFRRDRYTLLAVIAVTGGVLFSMGKYTVIYHLLYDYFPGVNRFRVPKMMMFVPLMGLGVLAARGVDILLDEQCRGTRLFKRYVVSLVALPLLLAAAYFSMKVVPGVWLAPLAELIQQPTRYEQGPELAVRRWINMVWETGFAAILATVYVVTIAVIWKKRLSVLTVSLLLLALYLGDVWRVNNKFLCVTDVPANSKGKMTATVEFLTKQPNQYRVLPISVDPAYLGSHKIPVMFTSMPVQQVRWQEILDTFSLQSAVPDMLNVRYLVVSPDSYAKERAQYQGHYQPVFTSPDGKEIVLENSRVLPKAWLVSSVYKVSSREQALQIMQSPEFDPRRAALIEKDAPLALGNRNLQNPDSVEVKTYEGVTIDISADTPQNSLLVLGEKYYQGWKAFVDGKQVEIHPVNNILRGIYLTPGKHDVKFRFDPLPFKIGKILTLSSFALFFVMLFREWRSGNVQRNRGE